MRQVNQIDSCLKHRAHQRELELSFAVQQVHEVLVDFILPISLLLAFFVLRNCVEAEIKELYSTLKGLSIKLPIAGSLLKLMELTADQVLSVLENLLSEEILRDSLIRDVSTVEL